ncbi:GRK6 isoform 11, partial [Pongo abelii]
AEYEVTPDEKRKACGRRLMQNFLSHTADPRVPERGPFCRLPRQHLLQPFPAVEVAGKAASDQKHLQAVPSPGQRWLWGGVRLPGAGHR